MNPRTSSFRFGAAVAAIVVLAAGVAFYFGAPEKRAGDSDTRGAAEALKGVENPNGMTTEKPNAPEKREITGAVLKTSFGEIEVAFFREQAPKTVENFVKLAESGFYDGTKFHRVIKNFMIQGGDPQTRDDSLAGQWGTGGPGYQFTDEISDRKIVRGVLAMANSGPNTNGSQFFIVTAGATPWLQGQHTVFGKVTRGMDVVDRISAIETGERDIPKTPAVIEGVLLK